MQLVHRLWLNFRRDPEMQDLHHSDIVTYALVRLAGEYAHNKEKTLSGLRHQALNPVPLASLSLPESAESYSVGPVDPGEPDGFVHPASEDVPVEHAPER